MMIMMTSRSISDANFSAQKMLFNGELEGNCDRRGSWTLELIVPRWRQLILWTHALSVMNAPFFSSFKHQADLELSYPSNTTGSQNHTTRARSLPFDYLAQRRWLSLCKQLRQVMADTVFAPGYILCWSRNKGELIAMSTCMFGQINDLETSVTRLSRGIQNWTPS